MIPFLLVLLLSNPVGERAEFIVQGYDSYQECADSREYLLNKPYTVEDRTVWHIDQAICTKDKMT